MHSSKRNKHTFLKKERYMFENLSSKLSQAFKSLSGRSHITDINIAESLKDVRRALIDADVSYKVAKEFTDKMKERALGQKVLNSVEPGQQMIKLVHDGLIELMGTTEEQLNLKGNPAVILMSGLQGSGKTTLSAKLANLLKKEKNKKVMLVACDVYRPAAIDQLQVLGAQIGVEVYAEPDNKKPVDIAKKAVQKAKDQGFHVVIVDTAGRLAVDEEMMEEIGMLKQKLNPQETLFVVDAMTGQDAVNTAKAFNDRIDFDGVVLTKLDGDTRGGAAISIRSVVNKPIKFVGTGEKIDAIDVFYPARMADRILGMGDIVSFVELAQKHYDEEEAKRLQRQIAKNQFNFNDYLGQIHQIKKMGNVKDLLGMLPGMGKALQGVEIKEDTFKPIEAIIYSMTPEEREHPDILDASRRKRIAAGSGTSIQEVNKFIKQFEDTRKVMKMMQGGKGIANMMRNMRNR